MKNALHTLLLCACLVFAPAAVMAQNEPIMGVFHFTVLRDGTKVGEHTLTFSKGGDDLLHVDIKTWITIKMLFVTAHSFTFEGRETWQGDRLIAFRGTSVENDKTRVIKAVADGDDLSLTVNDVTTTVSGETVPSTWWNRVVTKRRHVLNIADGRVMDVRVEDKGAAILNIMWKDVAAQRYTVSGGLDRDIWYSQNNHLLKTAMTGRDGSKIEFVMK
jgi:hypothetical protein